ncbi:hypothetical protein [Nocardioides sp.]|uniref:hypothetical protein n=1 Tax=Nocardioides sp. TaxID=35761 RepID=UPI002B96988D|nr:hypothetical protein [Nocardioides sp.]HXH77337.1 hypothetical protein [Nocardioides sp.]
MSAADEVGAELLQEATNIGCAWLEIFEMQVGGPVFSRDTEREAFEIGVNAGFIGAIQALQKRNLLPGLTPE